MTDWIYLPFPKFLSKYLFILQIISIFAKKNGETMYGLSERSFKELLDILSSIPEIEEASIYGSRARGEYWRASDIDLSLKGKHLNRHVLRVLNDKLYESHIPYFFDTTIFADIKNPKFRDNIIRDGKVLFKR